MAATVPVEKAGDVNPLLEAASEIGQPRKSTEEQEIARHEAKVVDPNPGTYEAFMSSFGNPRRWAGR